MIQLPTNLNHIEGHFDVPRCRVHVTGRCAGEHFEAELDVVRERATVARTGAPLEEFDVPDQDDCPGCPKTGAQGETWSLGKLARGGWGIFKAKVLQSGLAPESVIAERKAVCEACPIYDFGICREERGGCGCVLDAKISLAKERCPKDHWEPCDARD